MKSRKIKIVVVDDHFVVRMGLVASLNLEPDLKVVDEAGTGAEAIAACQRSHPDVVLMDLRLPDQTGAEATAALRAQFPQIRVLILSSYAGQEDVHQAFKAGAEGYLLKSSSRRELLKAIREVAEGRRHIPPEVASRLAERLPHAELTSREIQILQLIAQGKSNKEIGVKLNLAEITIKQNVSHLLEKLGASDRAQAVSLAVQRGYFRLDSQG